jgi:glyoxylase I family protein
MAWTAIPTFSSLIGIARASGRGLRGPVSQGDCAVGLDGNHAHIAMLRTPDGNGLIELFEYIHPEAIMTEPTRPNEIGMHRIAFSVDDLDTALEIAARHGCHPLRGVATYEDVYKLTYVRGPSGIIVMLAEELHDD